MAVKIQVRRGDAAAWVSANPVLMVGELGFETDTGQWKIGNGTDAWDVLAYAVGYPDHEWDNTSLRFKNPDGSWGGYTDLKGETGSITSPLTNDIDFDGYKAIDAIIESYGETAPAVINHAAAGSLTLDVDGGNVFRADLKANVTSLIISNAKAGATTSLTLELMPDASGPSFVWLAGTAVISAQITVSASDTDNSFNCSASGFAAVLVPGDLITTSGFTNAGNNDVFRVVSATTAKIVVADSTEGGADLTTEAAGESVTITRNNLIGDTPSLPDPFVTLVVTLWSHDGARWKIAEVGEH